MPLSGGLCCVTGTPKTYWLKTTIISFADDSAGQQFGRGQALQVILLVSPGLRPLGHLAHGRCTGEGGSLLKHLLSSSPYVRFLFLSFFIKEGFGYCGRFHSDGLRWSCSADLGNISIL